MNKYFKITLVISFSFILLSCSKNNLSEQNQPIKNQVSTQSAPENFVHVKTNDDSIPELKEIDKFVIYAELLRYIRSNGSVFGKFDSSDALFYSLETIPPTGIEQIENSADLPQSLIGNLKTINRESELLDEEYGVKAPVGGDKGDRDLKRFYEIIKRKYPDTKGVINFSKIGFDYGSRGLVYAEFYRPEKGVVKFYLVIKFSDKEERILPGTIDANILGISKIYQVS